MNLLVLKNFRSFGSDGLLLRAVLENPKEWYVIALVDSLSKFSDVDLLLEGKVLNIQRVRKNNLVGRLLSNFLVWFYVFLFFIRNRKIGLVVCGSIELAVIAQTILFFVEKKYYLFSDLTRFHLGRFSFAVRFLERMCLRFNWMPCVTSPGFLSGYLSSLVENQSAYLVHNIDPEMSIGSSSPDFGSRLIVWAGLLRCSHSISIASRLIERDVRFSVRLAGTIDCLDQFKIGSFLKNQRVLFLGKYSSSQLNSIYAGAAFSWCCDWSLGDNSKLLLTNRLYQSIAAGVPILASEGSYTAKVVKLYNIGLVIPPELEVASSMISSIREVDYDVWVDNLRVLATAQNFENPWIQIFSNKAVLINSRTESGAIFG